MNYIYGANCIFEIMYKWKKLFALSFIVVCSCKPIDPIPKDDLTAQELEVLDYFKEIALGFEFGSASKIVRKWNKSLSLYPIGNWKIYEEEL